MHSHAFDMELDGLAHELASLFKRRSRRDASRKVRNMGAITVGCGLKENCISAHFSSVCFSIDRSVFGSKSADG